MKKAIKVGSMFITDPVMTGGCTIYFKFGAPQLCIPASRDEGGL
jgi:hypothetical protein